MVVVAVAYDSCGVMVTAALSRMGTKSADSIGALGTALLPLGLGFAY